MPKRLLICLVIMLFLGGCTQITEGEVYHKEFQPAHSTTIIINQVRSMGKSVIVTPVPWVRTYPDTWIIKIRQPNEDGTFETATFSISEELYNSIKIGDYYVREVG